MNKIYFYFWNFMICSILGFVIETIWCIIRNKRYESRKGLLYGPFIPIYGIAGLLLAIIVTELNINEYHIVFLLGLMISTIIEYLCSYLQEKIFGSKSWDYSDFSLNLKGRVNLTYSIFFGLYSIFWYVTCYKVSLIIFSIFNHNLIAIISIALMLYMIYDILISCIAVYRVKMRKKGNIKENKFWSYIDKKYPDEKVLKAFANMEFI